MGKIGEDIKSSYGKFGMLLQNEPGAKDAFFLTQLPENVILSKVAQIFCLKIKKLCFCRLAECDYNSDLQIFPQEKIKNAKN